MDIDISILTLFHLVINDNTLINIAIRAMLHVLFNNDIIITVYGVSDVAILTLLHAVNINTILGFASCSYHAFLMGELINITMIRLLQAVINNPIIALLPMAITTAVCHIKGK